MRNVLHKNCIHYFILHVLFVYICILFNAIFNAYHFRKKGSVLYINSIWGKSMYKWCFKNSFFFLFMKTFCLFSQIEANGNNQIKCSSPLCTRISSPFCANTNNTYLQNGNKACIWFTCKLSMQDFATNAILVYIKQQHLSD